MKKLLLVTLMITGSLFAETAGSHGASSVNPAATNSSAPVVSQDKNAKLFQYVNACMVNRPAADDVKALLSK